MSEHATVKIGEFTIPLIGVAKAATEEVCDNCGRKGHITEFVVNRKSGVVCADGECTKPKIEKNENQYPCSLCGGDMTNHQAWCPRK